MNQELETRDRGDENGSRPREDDDMSIYITNMYKHTDGARVTSGVSDVAYAVMRRLWYV